MARLFRPDLRKLRMVVVATLLAGAVTPTMATARVLSPVVPFLLKPGEVSAIDPGKPQVFRTAAAVRNGAGELPREAIARRYESEGFVEAAIVRLHDQAE